MGLVWSSGVGEASAWRPHPRCRLQASSPRLLRPPAALLQPAGRLLVLFAGELRIGFAGETTQHGPGNRNFSMQQMAMSLSAVTSPSLHGKTLSAMHARHSQRLRTRHIHHSQVRAVPQTQLQYQKLGDSDLVISKVTLGTMTFGEQNTEKEAHGFLSYSFDQGVNILDTAEIYPLPFDKETQGRTDLYIGRWMQLKPRDKIILATKVAGYSERFTFLRDSAKVVRVDAANIREGVEKSLKHTLVRYIGVSNETSYGVMEFVHAAKAQGFPKIVSIQNSYSLLVRCCFDVDLVEVCHPSNCNVGLLANSPLAGGVLTGKYLDANADISKRSRLNLFPGFMARNNSSLAKEATNEYVKLAKRHGLTPVQLALVFVRDRPFTTSSIIGATTMDQLKENIDAFSRVPRPLPQEVLDGIDDIYKRYRDPAIL
ncbi:hypothetical protein U9M48_009921 [Paspalum notatum var. saurae]|uniref:NADP-dependent oxidoreductase domain-containing protein n=1 Tax=Paspalum notatum var. saurae TaxID=547442 RepID=A0AAQ3SS90_PASNO